MIQYESQTLIELRKPEGSNSTMSAPSRRLNLALYVLWVLLAALSVWLILRGITGNLSSFYIVPAPLLLMYFVKRKNTAWKRNSAA